MLTSEDISLIEKELSNIVFKETNEVFVPNVQDCPYYLEEIDVVSSIPDGKAYYDHIISNVEIDRSNPNNSYIMYLAGKVDVIDITKPCTFVEGATSLPDIDTDFPTDFRELAIEYVKDKYGIDKVCQIATYGRLSGRSAVKAALRADGSYDYTIMNTITEKIPDEAAISDQLEEMDEPSIIMWVLENKPELVSDYCYLEDGILKGELATIFEQAIKLEGTIQNQGKHAAGLIIASESISDNAPMLKARDGSMIAAMDMGDLEKLGLVKFDFLGVDILNKIAAVMGTDIINVPLDDGPTWDMIGEGRTKGCFQIESHLGRGWAKELKPNNIHEAAALISVIRPGTLLAQSEDGRSMTKVFCDRKNGLEPLSPDDPLTGINDTFNVIIYQETIMQIAKDLAGFNSADAIRLMKSVGKKDAKLLFSLEDGFLKGCSKVNRVSQEQAIHIFNQIKKSARYCFNRCCSSDEKLMRPSTTYGYTPTVHEMYKITTDREYAIETEHYELWKKNRRLKCFGFSMSIDIDGRIRKNKIIDIIPSGKRQCFVIETMSGKKCEVTNNHKFPTPNGDKRLDELSVGQELFICGSYEKSNGKKYNWSGMDQQEINIARSSGLLEDGRVVHGNFREWSHNKKSLSEIKQCQICSQSRDRYEIDHIDGDRTNNNISNLQKICVSCHKKKEYQSGRVKRGQKGYPVITEKIKSISAGKFIETYDITMEAPNHNYVFESKIVSLNSHAVGYSYPAYWSAYIKCHYPLKFYKEWMQCASHKLDPHLEMKQLMMSARIDAISILPPSVKHLERDFFIRGESVHFGLSSVKAVSDKELDKLFDLIKEKGGVDACNPVVFLLDIFHNVNKRTIENLIEVGAFDYTKWSRSKLKYYFECLRDLTDKERDYLIDAYYMHVGLGLETSFDLIMTLAASARPKKDGGAAATKPRIEKIIGIVNRLQNPGRELHDIPSVIASREEQLTGTTISMGHMDDCLAAGMADATCKDFVNGKKGKYSLIVTIKQVKRHIIKSSGKEMAFLVVEDDSCEMENVVCFADKFEQYSEVLFQGNNVAIFGEVSQKGSFAIERVVSV
jgi:hypothetical protein